MQGRRVPFGSCARRFRPAHVLMNIGVLKGRMTRGRVITSALEVSAIGVVSGIAGYVLGTLFPHWINLRGT